jgi:hypothetical protein
LGHKHNNYGESGLCLSQYKKYEVEQQHGEAQAKGQAPKKLNYGEPPTNGARGIKTLYTSIDSTPLKDIFDLVGRCQYHYVGSVCKE